MDCTLIGCRDLQRALFLRGDLWISQRRLLWRGNNLLNLRRRLFGGPTLFARFLGVVGLAEGFGLVDLDCVGEDVALTCMAKNWRIRGRSVRPARVLILFFLGPSLGWGKLMVLDCKITTRGINLFIPFRISYLLKGHIRMFHKNR